MKMVTNEAVEMSESPDGLPRRRAIQGIAGSLAGIAALGAVSASAKNKNKKKKSKKGTLVRVETAEDDAIAAAVTNVVTATANCPDPGSKEEVFAVGGGFSVAGSVAIADFATLASEPTNNLTGWTATIRNDVGAAKTVTATAVCAYFRTK
jgi:hypothetical protein